MIDIHCHLEYMQEPEQVIAEARRKMTAIITSVADIKHKDMILELWDKNPDFLYVSFGLHPERISNYSDAEIDNYIDFIQANKEKVVAIGECGLDYLQVKEDEMARAKSFFLRFIELSKELKLPLIVHARNKPGSNDCFNDILKIITESDAKQVVFHCFSGSEGNLKYALDQGYWISFATVVCKSEKHKRLAEKTPLNKMLLETDSPWLDPASLELTNRPWKIAESAKVIAEIKDITAQEVLRKTEDNAKRVFRLPI